ncbi:hypothetical protein CHU95_09000 [Niveispirillum lacus]|uniref:Uncharacterized protein n=1 Tax=Niveispirillum lacus TaxID=1981099 RepID=A0A255Z1F5_9PROT|nr:hypothetical protein [Niveispirillum lacus]OYQ35337.1 hypothetical protein CHU95_09000 [Niveispirillum lacus]
MTEQTFGRYPADTLKADGLRSAGGLAVTLGPLALVGFDAHPLVAIPLLTGAGLFLWLGLRTLGRQQTQYSLRSDGLGFQTNFVAAILRWDQITGVKLRYYSTKKDRSGGWMQLTLQVGRRRHSIESQLTGFDAIAARVAELVLERQLPVDATTQENFLSLGHYINPS